MSVEESASKRPKTAGKYQIVLIRHGESEWNVANRFTGWYDCDLSEKGKKEAGDAGVILKERGYTFDIAYTSVLQRAIKTLWAVLDNLSLTWIPVIRNWRLNERHYGALQGLNKQETVDKHGMDQVMIWRRSYSIPPPELTKESEFYPGSDPKYASLDESEIPRAESLQMTGERFLPYWENTIVPDIQAGKSVLIVAHGNSLRALVKHLDDIPEDKITGLNIPTGVALVYDLDENFKPIAHEDSISPLNGYYLGDQEEIRQRIDNVAHQTVAK